MLSEELLILIKKQSKKKFILLENKIVEFYKK